jgi:large subunit ribosomal protein L9
MKVILLADVKGLGKAGDIKEVKSGYGFNYLLPEGLADLATPGAIKQAERFVAKRKEEIAKTTEENRALASSLSGKKVTIKSKAENGKLFGSVGREEIAAALEAMDIKVGKEVIVLDKAFKEVGEFPVSTDFGHGVKAAFTVLIESE